MSVVYLLHFDRPYKHAMHYRGSTDDLPARLAKHAEGNGARLLQVARAAGIGWQLARTWPGGRDRERQLKRQGGASRQCPLCGVTPRRAAPAPPPADDGAEEYTAALEEQAAAAWCRVHAALAARLQVTERIPGGGQ